jgi:lipopolysaccharide/colanic/teichoic acid biosynthesis glycosyltransferase
VELNFPAGEGNPAVSVAPAWFGPEAAARFEESILCRVFNLAGAFLSLLVLSPVLLMTALLVRLTSRGPILYRGKRVGKYMREFQIFKFRTMEMGAEEKIGARLTTADDPYFTALGRFLKATRLDELPQLLNVLRGEMNLVGPRPIRPVFLPSHLAEFPDYWRRFLVRPGMTCISHVSGGFYSPVRQRLRHDLVYIENRSMWLDLQIFFWTIMKVLGHWLQPAIFLAFLFLVASYLPRNLMAHFYVQIGGAPYNVFYIFALLGAGFLLGRGIRVSRFIIYRSPLHWFVGAFALVSFLSVTCSSQKFSALRGAGFLWATGILPAKMIIHSDISGRWARKALKFVALCTGITAALGLLSWLAYVYPLLRQAPPSLPWYERLILAPRASGLFGEPIVFASYVAVGLPIVFLLAHGGQSRWSGRMAKLAVALGVIAILVSQSRTALAAMMVSGPLLLWKFSRRKALLFLLLLSVTCAGLGVVLPQRFSPAVILGEMKSHLKQGIQTLEEMKGAEYLWGAGPKTTEPLKGERRALLAIGNLPLRFFVEYGALGSLLVAVLLSQVLGLCFIRGQRADPGTGEELWSLGSSIVAFLVAANGFPAFYQISTQLMIWGVLALPCGIVLRRDRRPGERVIWRIRKHGDDFAGAKPAGNLTH